MIGQFRVCYLYRDGDLVLGNLNRDVGYTIPQRPQERSRVFLHFDTGDFRLLTANCGNPGHVLDLTIGVMSRDKQMDSAASGIKADVRRLDLNADRLPQFDRLQSRGRRCGRICLGAVIDGNNRRCHQRKYECQSLKFHGAPSLGVD